MSDPIIPTANDVLCGRGGKINRHQGNVYYRQAMEALQEQYSLAAKAQKRQIASEVVAFIRGQNGRFLQKASGGGGAWEQIDDDKATKKTIQAFRESLEKERRSDQRKKKRTDLDGDGGGAANGDSDGEEDASKEATSRKRGKNSAVDGTVTDGGHLRQNAHSGDDAQQLVSQEHHHGISPSFGGAAGEDQHSLGSRTSVDAAAAPDADGTTSSFPPIDSLSEFLTHQLASSRRDQNENAEQPFSTNAPLDGDG